MKLDFEYLEKKILDTNAKSEYKQSSIIILRKIFKEAKTKQLHIHDAVGQSEQLLCYCDNPNGFKEMEEGRETCSKCKKPY